MKLKIITLVIIILLFIIFLFQFKEVRRLNRNIKEKETLLISIQKNNEIIYKEQKDILQAEIDKISKVNSNDCINSPINIDIVKLLQKSGI